MKVAWALVVAALLTGGYVLLGNRGTATRAAPKYTQAQLEDMMQGVFIGARPAIVQLQTIGVSSTTGEEQTTVVARGRATGFFISADGYALTAYHAVSGQDRFQALTTRQELLDARVVGFDESRDLAVLKVDVPRRVEHLELEDTRALEVGEALVEVGNAEGDFMQPRYGAVSSFEQDPGNLVPTQLVYSSIVLNPGDSGGAVLDFHGRAVAVGIGFAVSDVARFSLLVPVHGLRERITAMKTGLRERLPGVGLHVVHNDGGGVLIDRVEPGSSANEAGLRGGTVVAVDGAPVYSQQDYHTAIRAKTRGQRVTLNVKEQSQNRTFTLELR
jgi:S1-C subfamily serine protease